jgi:hypothetical protein
MKSARFYMDCKPLTSMANTRCETLESFWAVEFWSARKIVSGTSGSWQRTRGKQTWTQWNHILLAHQRTQQQIWDLCEEAPLANCWPKIEGSCQKNMVFAMGSTMFERKMNSLQEALWIDPTVWLINAQNDWVYLFKWNTSTSTVIRLTIMLEWSTMG